MRDRTRTTGGSVHGDPAIRSRRTLSDMEWMPCSGAMVTPYFSRHVRAVCQSVGAHQATDTDRASPARQHPGVGVRVPSPSPLRARPIGDGRAGQTRGRPNKRPSKTVCGHKLVTSTPGDAHGVASSWSARSSDTAAVRSSSTSPATSAGRIAVQHSGEDEPLPARLRAFVVLVGPLVVGEHRLGTSTASTRSPSAPSFSSSGWSATHTPL